MGTLPVTMTDARFGEALRWLQPCRPLGYPACHVLVSSALAMLQEACADRAQFGLEVVSIVSGRRLSCLMRVIVRPNDGADVADANALAECAAERISATLYRAYRVTRVIREDIHTVVGVDPRTLPLSVSVFISRATPDVWVRIAWFQPIIDCQMQQASSSLVAFRLTSAPPDPARPWAPRYSVTVMTLGVADGSPIFAAIADQLCGRGQGVVAAAAPASQPTLDFAPVTDASLRAQIVNLDLSAQVSGQLVGSNVTLEARDAALLLPLPQLLGR